MMETDTETRVKTGFLRTLRIFLKQIGGVDGKKYNPLEKGITTRESLAAKCREYAKRLGKRTWCGW